MEHWNSKTNPVCTKPKEIFYSELWIISSQHQRTIYLKWQSWVLLYHPIETENLHLLFTHQRVYLLVQTYSNILIKTSTERCFTKLRAEQ